MNKLRPLLVFIFATSSLYSVQDVMQPVFPSRENIAFKKQAFERDAKISKNVMVAVYGATSAAVIFLAYKYIKEKFFSSDKALIINDQKILEKPQIDINADLVKRLGAVENCIKGIPTYGFFSFANLKKFTESVLTSVLMSGASGIVISKINKYYKKYNGYDNLSDFMSVNLFSIADLSGFVERSDLPDESLPEFYTSKLKLVSEFRNIVSDFESLIAFMEFKIASIDGIIFSKEDLLIPDYLYQDLYSYSKNFYSFVQGELDKDAYYKLTTEFFIKVKNSTALFRGLESRINWLKDLI